MKDVAQGARSGGPRPLPAPSEPVDSVELGRTPASPMQKPGMAPWSPAAPRLRQYIVLPPADKSHKADRDAVLQALQKSDPTLRAVIQDDIPFLNGVTVALDDRGRDALRQLGYVVSSDEPDRFLLPTPPEEKYHAAAGDPTDEMPAHDRMEPRQQLSEPRFVGPLTQKYLGRGVTVAFLDTGVYPHPDLTYPNSRLLHFEDFVAHRELPYDDNGHGTHVTGDATGNGFKSSGLYRGPAPEANAVVVKVLDRQGRGRMSNILKGINWVIDHKDQYGIRILNLSLGNRAREDYQDDPIERAVERAVDAGLVVVAAAGNEGPEPGTISAPGDNPKVITVGAVDDNNTPSLEDDRIPEFSSRGPTPAGHTKPDILAPGEAIIGLSAPVTPTEEQARRYGNIQKTLLWLSSMPDDALIQVPAETLKIIGLSDETIERIKASPGLAREEIDRVMRATSRTPLIDTGYVGSPGTSMATPIVSGVCAEILEANPNLTPAEVKTILRETASPLPHYDANSQGAGVINPSAAIAKALAMKGESHYQTSIDDLMREARAQAEKAPKPSGEALEKPVDAPPAPVEQPTPDDGYIVKG